MGERGGSGIFSDFNRDTSSDWKSYFQIGGILGYLKRLLWEKEIQMHQAISI